MPHKSSGLPPTANPTVGMRAADVMRLLIEGAVGASLDDIDVAQMSAHEIRRLQDAVFQAASALSDEDKEDVDSGEPDRIRRFVERVRLRNVAANREEAANLAATARGDLHDPRQSIGESAEPCTTHSASTEPAPRDGLTQSRRPRSPESPAHASEIPADEPMTPGSSEHRGVRAGLGADELTTETMLDVRPVATQEETLIDVLPREPAQHQQGGNRKTAHRHDVPRGFERLMPTEPVTDPVALKRAAQVMIKQVVAPAMTRTVDRALSDPRLGRTKPVHALRDGFPAQGHSGAADRHPLLQFAPPALREVLERLGVRTLADFLIRVMFPESRLVLSRHVGLPVTSLLVAGHRAELLDLPVRQARARPPHIKDVLLLSRLGVTCTRDLGRLADTFNNSPDRLEIFAELVGLLQRAVPKFIGRNRITRHDLKEWAVAAKKRGTAMQIASASAIESAGSVLSIEAKSSNGVKAFDNVKSSNNVSSFDDVWSPAELAAEGILCWYLDNRSGEADGAWQHLVLRLMALLRMQKVRLSEQVTRRALSSLSSDHEALVARWQEQERARVDDERLRANQERYSEYLVEVGDEASLWMDLLPWQAPDTARADNMICFWVDPVPDAAHLGTDAAAPESLKAVYICMDMNTGAIAPFGGGIG